MRIAVAPELVTCKVGTSAFGFSETVKPAVAPVEKLNPRFWPGK
jgi:hypothetical protein